MQVVAVGGGTRHAPCSGKDVGAVTCAISVPLLPSQSKDRSRDSTYMLVTKMQLNTIAYLISFPMV